MKLRRNEFCPIHRSISCCGREQLSRPQSIRLGVQRMEDPHHPRRYRELRSPTEMRKLMNRKVLQQGGVCAICLEEFTDYNDVVPDHKNPREMGGAWRDDHPDNIQVTHWWCNEEKGSIRYGMTYGRSAEHSMKAVLVPLAGRFHAPIVCVISVAPGRSVLRSPGS